MVCHCGGTMVQGFIPDFGLLAVWTSVWVEGTPETQKSWRDRLKTGGGVSLEGLEARMLEAYRCSSCSLVQLYAQQLAPVGASPV